VQSSSSALEFASKKKLTRRERLLREIDAIAPCAELMARIEPHYPKGEGRGRPPIGPPRMLRMYVVQQCPELSDEGIEDAVYDSQAIRDFIGIDLARESAPDATAMLKFRRLLETHGLIRAVFDAINTYLATMGLMLRQGSGVDATIISAPSSTKEDSGTRDPEMHQTKKGNQWHFGMKAHIGAELSSGLVLTVIGTTANVNDVTIGNAMLYGHEDHVFVDAGYQGADKRDDVTGAAWHLAMKPSVRRYWRKQPRIGRLLDYVERVKAVVRAKVEFPFHIIKGRSGLKKVRYRGLAKKTTQLFTLFGLASLLIAKRRLFELDARGAS
jgi:IS5 family transposase